MKFLNKLFGDYSDKEVKRIQPLIDKIDALSPDMEKLSDEEL